MGSTYPEYVCCVPTSICVPCISHSMCVYVLLTLVWDISSVADVFSDAISLTATGVTNDFATIS